MNRARALATASLVTALGLLQAEAAFGQTQPIPLPNGPIKYTTVSRTVRGGPPFPVRAVFRTNEEYQRFFKTRENAPCDWGREFLILVHLGTQGSDGYTVKITSVERYAATPPTVTVKYRITKGTPGQGSPKTIQVNPRNPADTGSLVDPDTNAPCEMIKVAKPVAGERFMLGIDLSREQLRFFEEGGASRVGFNVLSRALMGQGGFEQLTVGFSGNVTVRLGAGEGKKTRVLLAELDRLATCAQNAQLRSLPRTIPTQQFGGRTFAYNLFDQGRRQYEIRGTLNYEGAYADRLRPLAQAFDLIMSRLERRPVRIEGTVEAVEEADAVKIQGTLGLSFYLRGPLARKLAVLAGKKVIVEAVAELKSATNAEGVIGKVLYPQRSQIAGTITQQGGGLAIVGAPPLPEIALKLLGPRAEELAGPEIGNTVMLDMWLFFNNQGIPTEGYVESILASTIAHVVLRDRPDAVSLPTGELPRFTTVWVSQRRGGADGLSLANAQRSGWVPSQLLRFVYQPKIPGLADGLNVNPPPDSERGRIERDVNEGLDRSRNPNLPPPPR